MTSTNKQSAYETGHLAPSDDIDADIEHAMYAYLVRDFGLSEAAARDRASTEVDRSGAKNAIAQLAKRGIDVKGKKVLDLGAGLGAMSEELVIQGAETVAIEPGSNWASFAERRASRRGPYELHQAVGEALPFPDASMDVVISLQVLEHVQDPKKVIEEVARVLKPGGYFYLTCANYCAFREDHYRVFWLPWLPKRLGALYLRARGRSPQFLHESVTYVSFAQVMRWTKEQHLTRLRDEEAVTWLRSRSGRLGRVSRFVPGRVMVLADRARRSTKFAIVEPFVKG